MSSRHEPRVTLEELAKNVTIGIPTLNGGKKVVRVVRAVQAMGVDGLSVVVVDDGSSDNTAEAITSVFGDTVTVVRHCENKGVSAARNSLISLCKSRYCMLTDDDTIMELEALIRLYSALRDDPDAAMATPRLLSMEDGRVHGDETFFYFLGGAIIPNRGKRKQEIPNHLRRHVQTASGGMMMVNVQKARHYGGFDTDYRFGYADGELCLRMTNAGERIIFVPDAEIVVELKSWGVKRAHLQVRNRWFVILANYNLKTMLVLSPLLLMYECMLVCFMSTKKGGLRQYAKGMAMLVGTLPRRLKLRPCTVRTKVVRDGEWLHAGELFVNPSLMKWRLVRILKSVVELSFNAYWNLVRKYV